MGWIRNLALKTAVKKSLLDITEEIESRQKIIPGNGPYFQQAGLILKRIASERGYYEKETFRLCDSHEGLFYFMVLKITRDQLTSDPNFWDRDNLILITKIVGEWVLSLGGDLDRMIADTNREPKKTNKSVDISSTIMTCTNCSQRMRVPSGKRGVVTCPNPKCGMKFEVFT